jgi:hypothetical protein
MATVATGPQKACKCMHNFQNSTPHGETSHNNILTFKLTPGASSIKKAKRKRKKPQKLY